MHFVCSELSRCRKGRAAHIPRATSTYVMELLGPPLSMRKESMRKELNGIVQDGQIRPAGNPFKGIVYGFLCVS
jgi:hypothetical protein